MSNKVKVAVRLDDITPDMDWERFFSFKELLDRYGIKPLVGVVPDNRDDNLIGKEETDHPEFWSYFKQLREEGWSIAMHGFRHIYSTKKGGLFPLNNFSEFAGLPYEKQLDMLTEGKRRLEEKGFSTTLFMAPAHSYDKNTLRALKDTGFQGLTDGFGSAPYTWQGLTFYPISFRLKDTFRKKSGYSTLVVHTGTVSLEDLKKYEGYFQNPQVEWISYGEYLEKAPVGRNRLERVQEYMMAWGKHAISGLSGLLS